MDHVKLTGAGSGKRLVTAVRKLPRTLREDMWTGAADPLPRMGEPGWPVWRPVFWMVLVVFTVTLGVIQVGTTFGRDGQGITWYALLLPTLQAAALLAAMSRPMPAWWASTTLMVVVALVSEPLINRDMLYPWSISGIALQSAVLFLVALRVRPWSAVRALVITLLAGVICTALATHAHNYVVERAVPFFLVATVLGAALRGIRVARGQLVVQAELTAEERSRRTVLEERNRIARELHDVVAHHMTVISIQAQVAPHLAEDPSDALRENLASIRENAVDALTELRRVLGVLRTEDTLSEGVRHAPQPTLDRLDELVGTVRGAGITVVSESTGERRPLSPGVELSAFRIVQEALSNVMRHAPGARVRVETGYHSAAVTVRVTNTAPDRAAAPSRGVGHGLLGMRERTVMLGGDFANGPTAEGGYEVVATLPLEDPV
ncbi:sensor histidine kinase [Streptomyces sp. NPDC057136]|uniref:sensor histidine kinase n=1 Tax=Streptomyces sp. NPDC057136 TaxID=3346029 RepID=UPI003629D33E